MVSIVDSIWKVIRALRESICTVLLSLNMFDAEIKSTEKFGPSSLTTREIVGSNDNLMLSAFKKMLPVK